MLGKGLKGNFYLPILYMRKMYVFNWEHAPCSQLNMLPVRQLLPAEQIGGSATFSVTVSKLGYFPNDPLGSTSSDRHRCETCFSDHFFFLKKIFLVGLAKFPGAVPVWWTDSLGHWICDQKFPQHNFPIRLSSTENFREVTLRVL